MSFSGRNIQNFKGHFPVAMSSEQNPGGLAICTKGHETRKAKKIGNISGRISVMICIWRFPKMGGTPKSSNFLNGFSTVNHLAIGVSAFQPRGISAIFHCPRNYGSCWWWSYSWSSAHRRSCKDLCKGSPCEKEFSIICNK